MQGSFAYRTLNDPATSPPQQIDLDDGVFLPVSFLSQNGDAHPIIASMGYFAAVESVLKPLCEKRGWDLKDDKPSCVRVVIGDDAHLDFALYAIPDEDFEQLVEAELAKAIFAQDRQFIVDGFDFSEPVYQQIPEDHIMLAHRDEGWKPSDPRKLEDWFRDALKRHGEQVRRVSRYLKGWRDYHWPECRLSSIALMSCVITSYDQISPKISESRDDLALLAVAERLPGQLEGRIANPVVEEQFLDEFWTDAERTDFVDRARGLLGRLQDALSGTDSKAEAVVYMRRAFGERVPNDSSLIHSDEQADDTRTAANILTTGLLRDIANRPEPKAAVKREGERRYG